MNERPGQLQNQFAIDARSLRGQLGLDALSPIVFAINVSFLTGPDRRNGHYHLFVDEMRSAVVKSKWFAP